METKWRWSLMYEADKDGTTIFKEVLDVSTAEFQEAMNIYVSSFPQYERRSLASIKKTIISGKARLIIGIMSGQVVLMALLYPLAGTAFILLDYLAVSKEHRGIGLGKEFMNYLTAMTNCAGVKHLLVEVESPYIDEDYAKSRRARFYKKHGFKELSGLRYLLPPLQGTSCTDMILMVLSRDEKHHLDREEIRDAIVRIFEDLYCSDEGDEILASILEDMPGQIELV